VSRRTFFLAEVEVGIGAVRQRLDLALVPYVARQLVFGGKMPLWFGTRRFGGLGQASEFVRIRVGSLPGPRAGDSVEQGEIKALHRLLPSRQLRADTAFFFGPRFHVSRAAYA